MGYIIIHTNKKILSDTIRKFLENHSELIVKSFNFGSNTSKSCTAILKNNGIVLSWVSSMMKKYKIYEFHAFYSEWLDFPSLPQEIKDGGSWLAEKNGRRLKTLPNKENLKKMELESKIKLKKP